MDVQDFRIEMSMVQLPCEAAGLTKLLHIKSDGCESTLKLHVNT